MGDIMPTRDRHDISHLSPEAKGPSNENVPDDKISEQLKSHIVSPSESAIFVLLGRGKKFSDWAFQNTSINV